MTQILFIDIMLAFLGVFIYFLVLRNYYLISQELIKINN